MIRSSIANRMKRAAMTVPEAHFLAIAYDHAVQAERTRAEVTALAGAGQHLLLLDVAILTRTTDGSYMLNREPFPLTSNILAGGTLRFLSGMALAASMTGAAIGALLGTAASTVANALGMEDA